MIKPPRSFAWCKHGLFVRADKDGGFVELEFYDLKSGRTTEVRRLQPGVANNLGFVLEMAAIIAEPGTSSKRQSRKS